MKKENIEKWLYTHQITSYVIHDNLEVSVFEDVCLAQKEISILPFQFHEIRGQFDLSENQLTTLKNSPRIVYGYFDVTDNLLQNFEHCPVFVERIFQGTKNPIESLDFLPENNTKVRFTYNDKLSPKLIPYRDTNYGSNNIDISTDELRIILLHERLERTLTVQNIKASKIKV